MPKLIDLTGQRFGRLTVVEQAGRTLHGGVLWFCQCECGQKAIVASGNLRSGHTVSCGCLGRGLARERCVARNGLTAHSDHGEKKTRLYNIWSVMKERCTNVNSDRYKDYGGRGITVCAEWQNDYVAFRDWALLHGYRKDLTIDRIDNDTGYCPENCRWVTNKEQNHNRRNNRRITFRGETHIITEWSTITGINVGTISSRLSRGWSVERALTEPTQKRK